MKQKNPKSHRQTEANDKKTLERIETYLGKSALQETWDRYASQELQIEEHDYILGLRKRVRENRNYVAHRNDPKAEI